jgi:glycosyltransferase involved in cell wall biosynthesis
MRIGQNPAKKIDNVPQPEKVTVVVVTYIPELIGYYAHSLEVLKVCLGSIWDNTHVPYDLMVFDNGSCDEVRRYLGDAQERGRIQYLILSQKNYGKAGAWNIIFGAAPGKYIAYADSDVYHYPGWLDPQLKVLDSFPEAGMVTGMPMWTPEEFSTATIDWAESNVDVRLERGKFLTWEDYWKHSKSLGTEETKARDHFESTEDILVHTPAGRLFIGAAHFQFVAPKQVLSSLLPIQSERPMGQVRLLDIAMNKAGLLRFCTPDWWVMHMGNTLDVVPGSDRIVSESKKPMKPVSSFWKRKIPRKIAAYLYHKSFEILYKD